MTFPLERDIIEGLKKGTRSPAQLYSKAYFGEKDNERLIYPERGSHARGGYPAHL
jgi:hypothetical protein